MSLLTGILLTLLGILVLLAIISLFLPAQVIVTRHTRIQAPIEKIFEQVNDFRNWPNWMPWYEADPEMQFTYDEQTAGKGAGYAWKSKTQGNGSMKIIESIDCKSIKTQIDFGEQGEGAGSWEFVEENGGTHVTWGMSTDMSKPPIVGKYIGIMLDKMVGKSFDRGLERLKNHVETNA